VERLDKVLARHGLGSRREVGHLARAGRVTVDGETERDGGRRVDPRAQVIAVDGQLLPPRRHWHLLAHKPANVETSA
jgi:16S rRNA U516 pseudouridylate synthase RsuA-like enzyme